MSNLLGVFSYKGEPLGTTNSVRIEEHWQASGGQDGAIYGDYLFRFGSSGACNVYSLSKEEMLCRFTLDRASAITPHCNSVCFGPQRLQADDEFPLLYANIYNNYASQPNPMEGVCCVYRILREDTTFTSELVQLIRIGFTDSRELWRSKDGNDIRPYGNFAVDCDSNTLVAFTMIDTPGVTRYFTFDLPSVSDGVYDDAYECNVVTLGVKQIRSQFESDYSFYLQGACCHKGKLYSTEGLTNSARNRPRLQVIDLHAQKQCAVLELWDMGLHLEAEFADFSEDTLYYLDSHGLVRTMTFI